MGHAQNYATWKIDGDWFIIAKLILATILGGCAIFHNSAHEIAWNTWRYDKQCMELAARSHSKLHA